MSRQAQIAEAVERALIELNYAAADLHFGKGASGEEAQPRESGALRAKMTAAGRAIDCAIELLSSKERRVTARGAAA